MLTRPPLLFLAAAALFAALSAFASAVEPSDDSGPRRLDPGLPRFEARETLEGRLISVGSDTLNNLMTLWFEILSERHPKTRLEIEGKGSRTALSALLGRTADLGPTSRPYKPEEVAAFRERFGREPAQLRVAIDALAVFVHPENPVAERGLTLQELDAIFSSTRKRGGMIDIRTWGDLGIEEEAWRDKPIQLYGRNSASGTYGFFKMTALQGGDFKNNVIEQPGSSSVVHSVGRDRYGIGYSGIGYQSDDVAVVPLAEENLMHTVPPTPANSRVGRYPLSRFLLVTLDYDPERGLSPETLEFFRLVYSREGQEVVLRDGYTPLDFATARAEAAKLGITLAPALDEPSE